MIQPSDLNKFNLLNGLSEEQIENIIPLMIQEEYEPGVKIITEGKPNDKIYFITSGHVLVTIKDVVINNFSEGDAFGDMEVLDVMPATASINALSHIKVITISNKALRAIYNIDVRTFSLIVMNIARELSRRLRKMVEKIVSVTPIESTDFS